VHAPEAVCARVLVLVTRASRRLSVRPGLDVAAHRKDEPVRGRGDLRDGLLEGLGVAGRRLAEAAHLPHVLPGGCLDLTGRRWIVLVAEGSNASAHALRLPAVPQGIAEREL